MRTIENTLNSAQKDIIKGFLSSGSTSYQKVASVINFDPRNVSRWFAKNKTIENGILIKDTHIDGEIVLGMGSTIVVDPKRSSAKLFVEDKGYVFINDDFSSIDKEIAHAEDNDLTDMYYPKTNSVLYVGAIIVDSKDEDELDEDDELDVVEQEEDYSDAVWSASTKFISITHNDDVFHVDSDHPNFKEALDKLFEEKIGEAIALINVRKSIEKYAKGNIKIIDNNLFYKDLAIVSGLATRIISSFNNGDKFEHLVKFLENTMVNPSRKTVYRLFDFLQANDIRITENGTFVGWKAIRKDFTDGYTGTIDNSVGKVVSMPRHEVNDVDEETCSTGLHVCSRSYLDKIVNWGSWSNGIVVEVEVHPKDVVSIPTDYNNAKLRCCEYKVLAVVE